MNGAQKLTRAEACAALAHNIDTAWDWHDPHGCGFPVFARSKEHAASAVAGRSVYQLVPDYFSDRNAAAELVAWLAKPESGVDRTAFGQELATLADIDPEDKFAFKVIHSLLATPEQITLAALAALNIEVE